MDNNIKFSVVIPLYNKVTHIQRAINSVLDQTVQDFELIIVNDGSTDGSEKIVKQYDDKRIKLINQANGGESSARNRGIKEAEAQYIAFLDADDAWEKNFLGMIFDLITKYPEAGAYATALKTKERNGKYIKYRYFPLPPYPWQGIVDNYFDCLANGSYPLSSSTTCVKKEIFNEIGNFNTSLRIGPDIDMWIRTFLTTKIAFRSDIGAIYYLDAENRSVDIQDFNLKELELIDHLQRYLNDARMTDRYMLSFQKFLSIKLNAIILRDIINKRKKEATSLLFKYRLLLDYKQKSYLMIRLLLPKQLIDVVRKLYA